MVRIDLTDHEEALRDFLLDAYAEWEGSGKDMLVARGNRRAQSNDF